jgi:hypothetical protein
VNIVLANSVFNRPGGSETYLLTVSEELQRLGHETIILTSETGPMAGFATERGTSVTTDLESLDGWAESALVQDAILSYRLAERFPDVPQVLRPTSDLYDVSLPPGLPGVVSSVVVCNDRLRRRVESMAGEFEVHRLRQPVDTERFVPVGPVPDRPRRALLLGNYLAGDRLELLRKVLAQAGITVTQAGGSQFTCSPEHLIWEADFVVGLARAALDAMSCGKPVFLYDKWGCDGWVTPERYPAMEADNFAGQSRPVTADPDWLRTELGLYRPEMGLANRELAITHHSVRAHTHELCAILGSAPRPRDVDGAPLLELSRLVRMQWQAEMRAENLRQASYRAHEQLERERGAEGELERLHALLGTRRVRLGLRAGRMLDSLRGLGGSP